MQQHQRPIPPTTDLRTMLREHLVTRSLACMAAAATRRTEALASATAMAAYRQRLRGAVRGFYGTLCAGPDMPPPVAVPVSAFTHPGFRLENVLFETEPGWQVNVTVYVPTDYQPPFPVVIVPVGHSGKQFESYQLPCQYFACAGFLAICFDPPGQASEKQPGNDHFNDGVREYPVGRTSSRYFIADAIRCIDYAGTRDDADLTRGVAMTGVSGGGTTTTFAALLDDRITVTGPACCVTPLADLDISQAYAGCPESHPFRRYAEGVDEVDLLCAASPIPCLLMAGAKDEIFHVDETQYLADRVAEFYAAAESPERFEVSIDPGGHAYPLAQAQRFAGFMNRWLLNAPDRTVPELPDARVALRPYDELRCHPRTDVNMRTLATAEADRLATGRDRSADRIRRAAAAIAGIHEPIGIPDSEIAPPFQVWTHDWHAVMLRPKSAIELPGTLLTTRSGQAAPTLLHFDDAGRHRLLYRQGALTGAVRFLNRDQPVFNLFTVDLRGWGDTAPAVYPYEMAGWGSLDRYVAYTSAALGDPVLAMRIRDALAALAWLRTQPAVDGECLVISGCGLGGLVALHTAAIDAGIAGVVIWDGLTSFRSLLAAERYPWPADAFLPNVLNHYEIADLAGAIPAPVHVHNLRDGDGAAAETNDAAAWQAADNVILSPSSEQTALIESLERLLESQRV